MTNKCVRSPDDQGGFTPFLFSFVQHQDSPLVLSPAAPLKCLWLPVAPPLQTWGQGSVTLTQNPAESLGAVTRDSW